MRLLPCISGFLAATSLCISATAGTTDQPLKATPTLISQRYCSADDEVFVVELRLRMTYTNQTDKTLILDKEIGKAWYGVTVAHTRENLESGKYEYNPNIDWFFTDKDKLPKNPNLDGPGPGFAVLSPGQSFQSEIDTSVVAQYENVKNISGAIRSGSHVLQMQLSAWNRAGVPTDFEQSWKKGRVVTGLIKTDPLEIRVLPNPKVESVCK